MQGYITEAHLVEADSVFPGIARFFASRVVKPRTFLELVSEFEHWTDTRHAAITRAARAA